MTMALGLCSRSCAVREEALLLRAKNPPVRFPPGGVSTAWGLACASYGGQAVPSPLGGPSILPCARAVSPRPAFRACRLTTATLHLVSGLGYMGLFGFSNHFLFRSFISYEQDARWPLYAQAYRGSVSRGGVLPASETKLGNLFHGIPTKPNNP